MHLEIDVTPEKSVKLLHIFSSDNFTEDLFEFLDRNHFTLDDHSLFQYCRAQPFENLKGLDPLYSNSYFSLVPNIKLLFRMFRSEAILIHGLTSPFLLFYLFLFPSLCRKCSWAIWGKDLYFFHQIEKPKIHHHAYEFFRRHAIKRIPKIVTFNEGDYKLAQNLYSSRGKRLNCFMYPSNLFPQCLPRSAKGNQIRILIGNSADPSNNHLQLLNQLEQFKHLEIEITTPLVYGDKQHAKSVIKHGRKLFGNKFRPLTSRIPLNEYQLLLAETDIALFGHERQQAMGNIVSLLGLGKKVYLRPTVTTYELLESLGVCLFDIDSIDITKLDKEIAELNRKIIMDIFSEENLLLQWHDLMDNITNQNLKECEKEGSLI
jgi:hypothetical protein